jgi:putative membrane protein
VERGVDRTRARTGLLVYVSTLERVAEVVPDRGLAGRVDPAAWERSVAEIRATVANGGNGRAVAAQLTGLIPLIASAAPRAEDDVDELRNEVVA